jgi:hypothetical protein
MDMFLAAYKAIKRLLAPCDFFLFPKMKLKLKGRRFDGLEEIQRESDYFEGDAAQT